VRFENAKLEIFSKLAHSMIKFCTHCGADVSFEIPAGDTIPRHVCKRCGHIHYENPRLVVGCIASWEDRILLCRRAIEPRIGYWTLPAGFMENGETTAEAATRETFEEAGAKIILDAPFSMVSIAHINQVYLFYRGRLATADHAAGEESLEVCLVRPTEIPWKYMAFRSVTHCLERYIDDVARGCFGFHEAALGPPGKAI